MGSYASFSDNHERTKAPTKAPRERFVIWVIRVVGGEKYYAGRLYKGSRSWSIAYGNGYAQTFTKGYAAKVLRDYLASLPKSLKVHSSGIVPYSSLTR